MAKRTSPTQKKTTKRQYFGQSVAEPLVNWLNLTENKAGRERIVAVIRAFREAAAAAAYVSKMRVGKDGLTYEVHTPETRHRDKAEKTLDNLLDFYTVVPYIAFGIPTAETPQGTPMIYLGQKAAPGSRLARHSDRHSFDRETRKKTWTKEYDLPGRQMGEIGALRNLLELIRMQLIGKLVRCRCEKFFFIKFEHQKFCSEKCRVNDLRSNPEARKKRNEYARKLYHLHKSGKVK